jgi:putative FmdB family regulatory protein
MPIYEYQCQACGHHLESLQKVSDAALRKCPECGKPKLKKLLSAPSFRLKGGGWYETDFKSGNKRNLAEGAKEDKPVKAEPKPAKESAAKPKPAEKKAPTDKKSKATDA